MSIPINFNFDNSGSLIPDDHDIIAEARNPVTLVLADSQTHTGPHSFPLSISLLVDEPEVYLVRIVEITGSGPVVRNEYTADMRNTVYNTEPDIVWVVDRSGDDPVDGETEFYDPSLSGTDYRLVQRGVGPLEPGVEFDLLENPSVAGQYGVKLLGGRTFATGDTYNLQRYPPGTSTPRDLFLVVGRGQAQDPISGTDEYRYSPLAGKNYRIEKRGTGPKRPDEISIYSSGGFDLLNGDLFETGDTYVIHFYPTVVLQTPNNSSAGKKYDGMVELTASITTLDNTYIGKLISFAGAGSTCKAILPLGGSMPANRYLSFEHVKGNSNFGTIETQGGQNIRFYWNGNVVLNDQIWIGKNEYIELQWDSTNSVWIVLPGSDWGINEVGSFTDAYVVLPNTVEANGTYPLRSTQPRLWFIVDQFLTTALVDDVDWTGAAIGKFSRGDGSTTFRVPNFAGKTAYAGTVGEYQADQVGEFQMDKLTASSTSHGGASTNQNGLQVKLLVNTAPDTGTVTILGTNMIQRAGKENRVKRIGVLKLIRT